VSIIIAGEIMEGVLYTRGGYEICDTPQNFRLQNEKEKTTFEAVLIGGCKRKHIKEMYLTVSKQCSTDFRCDSDNKSPVPINTEEILDQLNFLPSDYYLPTHYGFHKMGFAWFIAQHFHSFRQFETLAIVPLMQVLYVFQECRVSGEVEVWIKIIRKAR